VIGGGWAGCGAAIAAKAAGADVVVLERTDCLLGTGLVGGIFRNNGRFTAAEEMIAMGGGDLFVLMDRASRHSAVEFPGHHHASLYDVCLMEPMVKNYMIDKGIVVRTITRATDVVHSCGKISGIVVEMSSSKPQEPPDHRTTALNTAMDAPCAPCAAPAGGRVSAWPAKWGSWKR
jgi:hypothetical protein